MKNLIILTALLIGFTIILPVNGIAQCCGNKGKSCCGKTAQTSTLTGALKDSLKVMGKCGMCKIRIETTAKSVKGVTGAKWNETTNMLVYSFDTGVKKEDISSAMIKVGHDTELAKASDKAYGKLPECCKYR